MISQDYTTTSEADRQKFYDALTGEKLNKQRQKRLQERFEKSGISNVGCSSTEVIQNPRNSYHTEYYRRAYHVRKATMVLNNPKHATKWALVELTADIQEDIEMAMQVLLMSMRYVSQKKFTLRKMRKSRAA